MKIFVRLLNEGTEVFRPVEAKRTDTGFFVLPFSDDDEEWEFPPGAMVEVGPHTFKSGETELIAIREISKPSSDH